MPRSSLLCLFLLITITLAAPVDNKGAPPHPANPERAKRPNLPPINTQLAKKGGNATPPESPVIPAIFRHPGTPAPHIDNNKSPTPPESPVIPAIFRTPNRPATQRDNKKPSTPPESPVIPAIFWDPANPASRPDKLSKVRFKPLSATRRRLPNDSRSRGSPSTNNGKRTTSELIALFPRPPTGVKAVVRRKGT